MAKTMNREGASSRHETSDDYSAVVARPTENTRIIICRGNLQWIVQQRVGGSGEWPWKARGYCRTRKGLVRVTAALDLPSDALEGFPEVFPQDARRTKAAEPA